MEAVPNQAGRPRRWPYRMKDLCDRTGLPRQAIHFYIQQGLVPPGRKTGRNMAYYGDQHVERLELVRRLQHERFLPLKAIRALLNDQEDDFSPSQRRFLSDLKQHLARSFASRANKPDTIEASGLLKRLGLHQADLDRMIELEMIGATRDRKGRTLVLKDDAWQLELLAEMRRIGFDRDLGFGVEDLGIYEEVVSRLFTREKRLIRERLSHLPPQRVASMIEHAIPVVQTFLLRYHESKIRNFVSTM